MMWTYGWDHEDGQKKKKNHKNWATTNSNESTVPFTITSDS